MLLIQATVKPSPIHGLGLFADVFIPKGTIIWRFTPNFDLRFSQENLQNFPEPLFSYLEKYMWKSRQSGLFCFACDDAKYFNHSDMPNTLSCCVEGEEEVITISQRDIEPGEELTDNYAAYGEDTFGLISSSPC